MTSFLFSFFSLSCLAFSLVLEVLNLNGCMLYWWRRNKHFIIAALIAHFLIFLSVLNKTVQLGKELSSLQSELGRILFLLKIADPSGEADQKTIRKWRIRNLIKQRCLFLPPKSNHPPMGPKKSSASGKPTDVSMQRQKTEVAVVAEMELNIMTETD